MGTASWALRATAGRHSGGLGADRDQGARPCFPKASSPHTPRPGPLLSSDTLPSSHRWAITRRYERSGCSGRFEPSAVRKPPRPPCGQPLASLPSPLTLAKLLLAAAAIPSLRIMVNSLMDSVKALAAVMALLIFSLIFFGILALQLYMGASCSSFEASAGTSMGRRVPAHAAAVTILLQGCSGKNVSRRRQATSPMAPTPPFSPIPPIGSSRMTVCGWLPGLRPLGLTSALSHTQRTRALLTPDLSLAPRICGNESIARNCPANYTCVASVGGNPNYGYTNFDNFAFTLLTMFRVSRRVKRHLLALARFGIQLKRSSTGSCSALMVRRSDHGSEHSAVLSVHGEEANW